MFRSKKKFRRLLLAGSVALIICVAVVGAVLAQDEPFIDYWPWERKPGMAPATPMETTPTPSDEEAKRLPKVTPPIIPTVEMIDTAPDADWNTKYQIILRRIRTGELVVLEVQLGIEPKDAMAKYINSGYELVEVTMPLGGPPPEPPPTMGN